MDQKNRLPLLKNEIFPPQRFRTVGLPFNAPWASTGIPVDDALGASGAFKFNSAVQFSTSSKSIHPQRHPLVISPPTSAPNPFPRILVIKADRLCSDALGQISRRLFPEAELLIAHSLADANLALMGGMFDLMVSGIELPDGDTLDFIAAVTSHPRRVSSVLIVTGRHESRILESLRTLPIEGMCYSRTDGIDEVERALRSLASGKSYWSVSALSALQDCMTATTIHRLLTPTEELTFSILGDGCDDDLAADKLNLTVASVSSLRREIHRKLKLQHRGELVRLAVQTGFVRLSKTGTFRPAFATMLSLCSSRKIPRAGQPVTLEAPSASCAII